jgi:SWI/SNF-related matrix-associated actin-dependent regulator of chromatin subfamily A-like protein 1
MNSRDKKEPWQKIIEAKLKRSTNTALGGMATSSALPQPASGGGNPSPAVPEAKDAPLEPVKIRVYVNEEGTVTIKPSSKRLSLILSKLDRTMYDIKNNEWRIGIEEYRKVRRELRENKFVYGDIPKGTQEILRRTVGSQSFELVGKIYTALLSFQREGVMYALNRNGRVILADDMGLGKTVQALAIAYYYRLEWPLLIISPASLLESWVDACRIFMEEECTIIRGKGDFGARVSVISYELAATHSGAIASMGIRVMIADECHYLKSQTTKRTKLIVPLLQNASRVLLLSGTPAVSRPMELYPIISALDRTIFPSFVEYGNRYCNGRKVGTWYDYKGCSNAEELYFILRRYLMIRRTKDEVLSQLPPKFRRQVILPAEKTQRNLGAEAVGEAVELSITMQYKEAAGLKMNSVKQYLSTMLKRDIKFIVFAHHLEMLDGLEEYFKEEGVALVRIDGSTPSSARSSLVREFQESEGTKVALLSITACSTGLTLTAGKAVVFAELYWNPGTLLQAEDRVHRIGQRDSVNIVYLVAKGTIDEYVWPKLLSKLNVLESLGIGSNELKNVRSDIHGTEQTRLDRFVEKEGH